MNLIIALKRGKTRRKTKSKGQDKNKKGQEALNILCGKNENLKYLKLNENSKILINTTVVCKYNKNDTNSLVKPDIIFISVNYFFKL